MIIASFITGGCFALGALFIFLYGLYLFSMKNVKDHNKATYD